MCTLRDPAQKESASWLVSASSVENAGDRAKLARALIEVLHMRQDARSAAGFDMEEANCLLESTTKKMVSLSKDEQEELYRRIKIKKRQAGAGVSRESERGQVGFTSGCARCGRTNHPYEECIAATTINHTPPTMSMDPNAIAMAAAKRGTGTRSFGQRQSGYAFSEYEPAPAAYYPAAPPVQQSFYAAPPVSSAPPAGPPMSQPGPWQGSTRGECYRCGKAGHVHAWCRAPEQEVAAYQAARG